MPKLGSVKLDVVYSEVKETNVKTTDRPVENGLTITDHVQRDPITLKITGVCSGKPAQAKLEQLEKYNAAGTRLTYTGRRHLTGVVIENLSVTRDADVSSYSFKFDMSLKQIRVVSTKVYKKKKTKPKASGGKKQPVKKNTKKRTYVVVKKNDTLGKIAQHFYGKSSYWTKIYNANRKIIKDPNRLTVGWKLLIP